MYSAPLLHVRAHRGPDVSKKRMVYRVPKCAVNKPLLACISCPLWELQV